MEGQRCHPGVEALARSKAYCTAPFPAFPWAYVQVSHQKAQAYRIQSSVVGSGQEELSLLLSCRSRLSVTPRSLEVNELGPEQQVAWKLSGRVSSFLLLPPLWIQECFGCSSLWLEHPSIGEA